MAAKKTDWASYEKALKQRGSISLWVSDKAVNTWTPKGPAKRGGQPKYSELAIETALTLRLVFHQALRQTEGLLESIFKLMELSLPIPDHTTLSRRGSVVRLPSSFCSNSTESLTIIVDSTGLKIFGAGEWCDRKHGPSKRRGWRKLHLSIDGSSLEIVEASLTDKDVGDSTEALRHIRNIENPINEILGDGAYDSFKIYDSIAAKPGAGRIVIPPPKGAAISKKPKQNLSQRDEHVGFIKQKGRTAWECKNGYSRRLLVENTMGRFKQIIGPKLRSRNLDSQQNEALVGCKILNQMVKLGTPTRPVI